MTELADRIARLCAELGQDGSVNVVAEAGAAEALGRIVSALRTDGADLAQVETDLDAVDEMLTRYGIDGLTRTSRGYRPATGASGHPVVYARVCPISKCSRAVTEPAAGTDPPRCVITGLPLRPIRLPT
ncbi:MAG: hypothetical protein ACRDRS_22280 [Pseudonocardiaceae bacterium]